MTDPRLLQRRQQFQQAVRRLQDACAQPENEFIRDSVIQRFEFCFELGWKMLRLKLLEEGIETNTPHASIRHAVAAQLLDDGNTSGHKCCKNATKPAIPTTRPWRARYMPSSARPGCPFYCVSRRNAVNGSRHQGP